MESHKELEVLFRRYLENDLSKDELDELLKALHNSENEQFISTLMDATWEDMYTIKEEKTAKVISFGSRFIKYVVAASVIAIIGITYFFFTADRRSADRLAEKPAENAVANHIVPGGDRATLTLADGSVVFLDSAAKGTLTEQGGITVINLEGQLAYQPEGQSTEVLYNTVTTPRGGQYQLVLADGSKVWLNAASSLRFPTAFPGGERTVELTGEGYFEVAHNASQPFHVKVGDLDVQVLGTHFNINSYNDEPSVKTTLLEGKVKVVSHDEHVVLNPGQQAVLQQGRKSIQVVNDVDLEEVVAWKDGKFLFSSVDLETVMRQVARWYDVDVLFEKKSAKQVGGGLPRSKNISQLLEILEATGKVEFEIKGREVIVKPK